MSELTNVNAELAHAEEKIERATRNAFYEVGTELRHIRDSRLYREGYATFEGYHRERWGWEHSHVYRLIDAADFIDRISPIGEVLPSTESQVRPLLQLEDPAHRTEVWQRVVAYSQETGERITARVVEREVQRKKEELDKTYVTLSEWAELSQDERRRYLTPWASNKTFNQTNENIEWALWTWNPVTGCKHGCQYCYARDIANRFYPQGFEPTFHPDRLIAPHNTKIPMGARPNTFVCSMADLFGEWVPQEWIDAVLEAVVGAPQWNFLFLSKNPERMVGVDWPDNAWVGTTVDVQARVERAEDAFRDIQASVKFLSCEPLLEPLTFADLAVFDWLIIGARSKCSALPEFQPDWKWVHGLTQQGIDAGCSIYWKPNLAARPKEYPGGAGVTVVPRLEGHAELGNLETVGSVLSGPGDFDL